MNVDQVRRYLNDTVRDSLTEDYQLSALKTAMQCLTGAAGANNVPADFCEKQLNKQRSVNWAVLPDKPSPIDGSVRPFAVIITIRGKCINPDLFILLLKECHYRCIQSYRLRFL